MQSKTDEISRAFSVDLVKAANEQLVFLRAAHHAGVSVTLSRESWRRYEECWLPMLETLEQGVATEAAQHPFSALVNACVSLMESATYDGHTVQACARTY